MRFQSLIFRTHDSVAATFARGVVLVFALSVPLKADAQRSSTLVEIDPTTSREIPRTAAPRSLPQRAPVTDARLFDDMTVILPTGVTSSDRHYTPASSVPAPRTATQPQAPQQLPAWTDSSASQEVQPSGADNLFASATIGVPNSATQRSTARTPSEAYVPMLPEDFYAPTNVQRDPVASEVGLPDMEPVGPNGEGFRYLQRRNLEVTSAIPGVVAPYAVSNIFSTYSDCRSGGRTHAGLDIGGVGPNGGIGTPVYAMARSKVTYIGRPEDDPAKFGQPDDHDGHVQRGPRSMKLPRRQTVSGYGVVNFFTRTYGSWRTGTIIVMEAIEGPLNNHRIRYMHLGAVHPELRVGDIVEAGQEVGLMGGTAVQHDMPHMHIDIEDAQSRRVDVAPFIGLPGDHGECRRR